MAVWIQPVARRAPWHAGTTCSSAHQLSEALHLVLLSVACKFPICFLQLVPEPLFTATGVQLLLLCLRWRSPMRSQVYLLIFCLLKHEFKYQAMNTNAQVVHKGQTLLYRRHKADKHLMWKVQKSIQ